MQVDIPRVLRKARFSKICHAFTDFLCNNIHMKILPFTSPEATLETAGGKGTNLARLTRAGFAVPRGFIIGR